MAKDTAESKLLKLIEETDAKDKAANPAAPAVSADVSKVLNSVSSVGVSGGALGDFFQKAIAIFSRGSNPSAASGLRFVNLVLLILIGMIGFFFMQDFSRGIQQSHEKVVYEVNQVVSDGQEILLPTVKDVTDYIAAISERNIFRPFEKKVEEAKVVVPLENQQIKDKLANFKLVGISWLNSPDTATAMIEDKSRAITLFLKTGEDLSKSSENLRGVTLDVIYADRVEFSFQGEKITLNL